MYPAIAPERSGHFRHERQDEMVLIKTGKERSDLDQERDAIRAELRHIRETVARLRQTLEQGEAVSATEAGKALSDLRTWLKHAKETESQIDKAEREDAAIDGTYGLDLEAARAEIRERLARLEATIRAGNVSDGA